VAICEAMAMLPTHYSFSWFDAFSSNIDWTQMIRGASYSIMLFGILIALAVNKFSKKDVTS
jgi:ABC-2 type transport system permease protein